MSVLGVPTEWEYSDDVDFADEDMEYLVSFLPQVKAVLGEWNLEVNESNMEFSSVYRAEPSAKDDSGQKLAGNDNHGAATKLLAPCSVQRRI